jgi:hypothetical protein
MFFHMLRFTVVSRRREISDASESMGTCRGARMGSGFMW